LRVLIADDHALLRSGLASLLKAKDIEVVGEANNGLEAIEKTRLLKPDIVLMDIKMPGCNGLEATRVIKSEMPQVKIVMVTAFDDDEDLFEAMKSGASGYILKNVNADEFFNLLANVMKGEVAVSPWIASKIVKEYCKNQGKTKVKQADGSDLTGKEVEVLREVSGGATNKEIASSLNISENTVKYHLRNIMEKLNFKNRAQMAVYAAKRGMEPDNLSEKS
jgi:DNA-binding NarL/FixJ family response regulator